MTDPLTGLSQTIPSLAPGAKVSIPTSYTVTDGDMGKDKIVNTATAEFTYAGIKTTEESSKSIPNAYSITGIDCEANRYALSSDTLVDMEVKVAYAGGISSSYSSGIPINLGNGDLTATLQAGTINPAGGFLVYRIQGTPATADKLVLPVNFGGMSCIVEIFIYEPNVGQFNFFLLTFNDLDKDCVKDPNENQEGIPASGMFMKIFDLNDNMLYVSEINSGQFDVNDFNGSTDVAYYYIIDDNDLAVDKEPSLPEGWNSGMSAPSLKRYFYYDGTLHFQNTTAVANLLDPSWSADTLPWLICLNQEPGIMTTLDCANAVLTGRLVRDVMVAGTSFTVGYTGGNGGFYTSQTVLSTGVTGLAASISKGSLASGAGTLTWTITGMPESSGTAIFSLVIGGQVCQVAFEIDAPAMVVTNTVSQSTYETIGEVLTYSIAVTNTGNVPLTNVTVVDSVTGQIFTIPSLGVGQSQTFTTTHTVTEANIVAGSLTNTTTATTTYEGLPVSATGTSTATAVKKPALSVTTDALTSTYDSVGDVLNYLTTVTNTGNVTLTDVKVVNPLTGLTETIKSLAPGEKVVFSSSYTATQADLDAGQIDHVSQASTSYEGKPVNSNLEVKTVKATQNPGITLTKEANKPSYQEVGELLTYAIKVTNTGNVTLTNVEVVNPLTGLVELIPILLPGQTIVFTTTYIVTQADLDAGAIVDAVEAEYSFGGVNFKPSAVQSVPYVAPVYILEAMPDNYQDNPVSPQESRVAGNVFANDLMNGKPIKANEVIAKITNNGGLPGVTINANGDLIVPSGALAGTYLVWYRICKADEPGNCSAEAMVIVEVLHTVNLRINKKVELDTWYEGDEFEYTLTVQNNGTTDATDVEIYDKLPAGLVYVSSELTGSTATTTVNGQEIKWSIASFPVGSSVEIKLLVRILPLPDGKGNTVLNTATVSSAGTELSPEDNKSSVLVNVEGFFIPNVITPNGDGFNDSFEIKGIKRFVGNEIVIFNRYGDHLYSAKNYHKEWSGVGLIDDTYFYVLVAIDELGKKHEYKGWIQIIRE